MLTNGHHPRFKDRALRRRSPRQLVTVCWRCRTRRQELKRYHGPPAIHHKIRCLPVGGRHVSDKNQHISPGYCDSVVWFDIFYYCKCALTNPPVLLLVSLCSPFLQGHRRRQQHFLPRVPPVRRARSPTEDPSPLCSQSAPCAIRQQCFTQSVRRSRRRQRRSWQQW